MNEPEGGKKPVFSTQSLTSHEKRRIRKKRRGGITPYIGFYT